MNSRPSWDEIWMDFAVHLSLRSTCKRASVGCVVVSFDNSVVLGLGYNGGAKGLQNDCLSDEPGKCFSGGVQVTTQNGHKRIKNVRVGDMVLTHLNRFRKVVRVIRSETATRDFVLIKFNGGKNGRFVSTANHPVYVKRGEKLEWVAAGDIKLTDLIVSAAHPCKECGADIPQRRELCLACFKASSKGLEFRDRSSQRNVKPNKYEQDTQYDDVIWHVENTQQNSFECVSDGFVGLPPKSIEIVKRTCPVYNLEVEEDHTYVCQGVSVHNCGHLHAEINALLKTNYRDAASKKAYITTSPCYNCSVALINAGVQEVIFKVKYRDQSGIAILSQAGIKVRQFPEERVPERYLSVDKDGKP